MKIIIEVEIEDCKDCPHFQYEGTESEEDVYSCMKLQQTTGREGIHSDCPFIKTTLEKYEKIAKGK